jgi:hypothetical protein
MPVLYTNRAEKIYTLFEGKTKTGKPRYFFSANTTKGKAKGEPIEQVPEGYEIYERPENAQVFLRKIKPKLITDSEKQLIEQTIKQLTLAKDYLVGEQDKFITIYESASGIANLKGILANVTGSSVSDDTLKSVINAIGGEYRGALRFELINDKTRQFEAQVYSCRGSIDRWCPLDGEGKLANLANKACVNLGSNALYESIYD